MFARHGGCGPPPDGAANRLIPNARTATSATVINVASANQDAMYANTNFHFLIVDAVEF